MQKKRCKGEVIHQDDVSHHVYKYNYVRIEGEFVGSLSREKES